MIRIQEGSQAITLSQYLRYLGILFDKKCNYNPHSRWIRAKTGELANKIIYMAKRTYGNKSVFIRKIVDCIAKPAALYGSEIWGAKADSCSNKRQLLAAQRPFLRAVVKCYSTTPTSALMVIGGQCPWWLEAKTNNAMYCRFREDMVKEKLKVGRFPSLPTRVSIAQLTTDDTRQTIRIYIDACCRLRTGIGVVALLDNEATKMRFYLDKKLDILQAEHLAVAIAAQKCINLTCNAIIYTDNKNVAMNYARKKVTSNVEGDTWEVLRRRATRGYSTRVAWLQRTEPAQREAHNAAGEAAVGLGTRLTLEKWMGTNKRQRKAIKSAELIDAWQASWDNDRTGRELYRHCQQVGNGLIKLSFKAVQLLTGLGNTNAYLCRFGLREEGNECACGQGTENVLHVMQSCSLPQRAEARNEALRLFGDLRITLREGNVETPGQVGKVEWLASRLMFDEEVVGREEDSDDD